MAEKIEARDARVGKAFAVALAANPTTGFDWQIAFPPELVRLEGRTHVRSADRVGAGGTTTFTLTPLRPGDAELRFRYLRIWEGVPLEEHIVRVHIAP